MDWTGSGNSGVVGDHVEVELFSSFLNKLNKVGVDNSSGRRIQHSCSGALLFEEPSVDFLVHKNVKNLWIVAFFLGLDCLGHLAKLLVENLLLHGGSTYAISIDDDLLGQIVLIVFFIIG